MTLPTYWTWAPPLGAAASDPRYVPMLPVGNNRVNNTTRPASFFVTKIAEDKATYGVPDDQIAITFNGWGYEDRRPRLWRHPDDALSNGDSSQSPFMASGIAEASAWTSDFITAWDSEGLPDPYAIWLDYEQILFIASQFTTNWAFAKADPRWSTEVCFYGNKTWADIVSENGIGDPPNPGGNGGLVNTEWTLSVYPWLWEAMSYALDQGLFGPATTKWPSLKTSNWRTTHLGAHIISGVGNFDAPTVGGTHQGVVLYASSLASAKNQVTLEMPERFQDTPYSPWIQFLNEGGPTPANVNEFLQYTVTTPINYGTRDILLWGNPTGSMASAENWNLWYAAAYLAEQNSNPAEQTRQSQAIAWENISTPGAFRPFNHPGL